MKTGQWITKYNLAGVAYKIWEWDKEKPKNNDQPEFIFNQDDNKCK